MDFYAQVNKAWLDAAVIPDDKPSWSGAIEIQEQVADAQRRQMEATDDPFLRGLWAQLLADKDHTKAVRALLAEVDALASYWDMPALVDSLARKGINTWFRYGVDADFKAPGTNVRYVDAGGLGLPAREYYPCYKGHDKTIYGKYEDMLRRLFRHYGMAWHNELMAYEEALAEKSLTRLQYQNVDLIYNVYEPKYKLKHVFGPGKVIIDNPGFLTFLDTEVPLLLLKSWLAACVFRVTAAWASPAAYRIYFDMFGTALTGVTTPEPLWRRAIYYLNWALVMYMGREYAKGFPAESKRFVEAMVTGLKDAMRGMIDGAEWLDSKEEARAKLARMRAKIAYPDRWREYPPMTVGPGLIETMVGIAAMNWAYADARAGAPVDPDEWPEHRPVQSVNASYDAAKNELVVACGFLQGVFFPPNELAPLKASSNVEAARYGAIGVVLGHEITHGFDSVGRKFDAGGALRVWWGEAETAAFEARAQQIVDAYSAVTVEVGGERLAVNGRLCVGENIADMGGVKAAYAAARRHLGDRFDEAAQRTFFEAYARVFRAKRRPAEARRRLLTDPHSPSDVRVNMVVWHNKDWRRLYGQEGDKEDSKEGDKEGDINLW